MAWRCRLLTARRSQRGRVVAEKWISHRSQAQEQHKEEIQGNVRRQLEIVKPDVTDEEIDTVLRADGSSNRVMRSAILRNSADPIKDAYAHAADRYQDVLKLEQSVAELHQRVVRREISMSQPVSVQMIETIEEHMRDPSGDILIGDQPGGERDASAPLHYGVAAAFCIEP